MTKVIIMKLSHDTQYETGDMKLTYHSRERTFMPG